MEEVRSDRVSIKAEFLAPTLKKERTALDVSCEIPASDRKRKEPDGDDKRVSLKKRHNNSHPSKEGRLCSFICKGSPCPFGEKCSYSHDVLDYISKKPADLGQTCVQYDTFGICPNGIMCRFGACHIDFSTGTNLSRPDELGGVIERKYINVLAKDVQNLLRKKQFNHWANKKNNTDVSTHIASEKPLDAVVTDNIISTIMLDADNNSDAANNKEKISGDTDSNKEDCSKQMRGEKKEETEANKETKGKANNQYTFDLTAYPSKCVKLVDFSNKVYVAPLTTVGNLPFRRILKEYGADITCGEMAMATNILEGQASEWALLRRHRSEDVFGVQLAGSYIDTMRNTARILEHETSTDFVDLNCGCPIDVVCKRGSGSALMMKPGRLCDIVDAMSKELKSRSVTVKIRTGWSERNPTAHELVPVLQKKPAAARIAAIMIHGRSRLQRYSKLANWEYVLQAAQSQDPALRRIPIVGNGDILSWEDWRLHQHLLSDNLHLQPHQYISHTSHLPTSTTAAVEEAVYTLGTTISSNNSNSNEGSTAAESEGAPNDVLGLCSCAMLGRGALIKPWLPAEIKEQRNIDMPATERLEMLKKFCSYGLEHWGSDQQGVNNTRRFLLEWQSFLHRYVPLGLLEQPAPQTMNQRPPLYFGRCDLETLLSSPNSVDWIRLSEMLLGPVPADFTFIPKHKSNSYASTSEADTEALPEG